MLRVARLHRAGACLLQGPPVSVSITPNLFTLHKPHHTSSGADLRRCDGDGVAGVDAHGVHILDGADDDHVVGQVAHDLQLELLPAQQALLDEDLCAQPVPSKQAHACVN